MPYYRQFLNLFFAAFITVSAFVTTPPAHAGLSDALNDMLTATATDPGIYQSQERGVLVGGSLSVRWPIRNISLLHIAPPSLQTGCGGIDFFGGSFSFINAEQFKQILRQIGTAAVGYAFQLAIATVCQECSSLMAWLQEMMNNINSLNASSCAIGAKIVAEIGSKIDLGDSYKDELKNIEKAAGSVSDAVDAFTSMFENPGFGRDGGSYAVQSTATGDFGGVEKIGNITYRALYKDSSVAALGGMLTGSGSVDKYTIEMMLSLVGTVIFPLDPQKPKQEGGCNVSPADTSQDCKVDIFRKIVSLQNIMWPKGANSNGGVERSHIYQCNNTNSIIGCMTMSTTGQIQTTLHEMIHYKLFGTTDITTITASAGSIVYKIQNGQTLTPEEQSFLNSTQIPLYPLMTQVQQDKNAVAYMAVFTERTFVKLFALNLAGAITSTINAAFSGDKDKPTMPDVVKEGLMELGREQLEVSNSLPHIATLVNQLTELARNVKLSLPATPVPPKQVR